MTQPLSPGLYMARNSDASWHQPFLVIGLNTQKPGHSIYRVLIDGELIDVFIKPEEVVRVEL